MSREPHIDESNEVWQLLAHEGCAGSPEHSPEGTNGSWNVATVLAEALLAALATSGFITRTAAGDYIRVGEK